MTSPTLKDIFALSADIIKIAGDRNLTIGTAESCTGGLIGAAITSISGSSTVFKGGIISYANSVKINQLHVPEDRLKTHGAVSEIVAKAMAENVREILNIDIAVSVTGIAGPGGGSAKKPVGTVWIGLATQYGVTATLHNFGKIGRNKVRDVTCFEALKAINKALSEA